MTEPAHLNLLGLRLGDLKRLCESRAEPLPKVVPAEASLVQNGRALRARNANLAACPEDWRVAQALTLPDGTLTVVVVHPLMLQFDPAVGVEGAGSC